MSALRLFVLMQAVIVTGECVMSEVFRRHLFFNNRLAVFCNY